MTGGGRTLWTGQFSLLTMDFLSREFFLASLLVYHHVWRDLIPWFKFEGDHHLEMPES